MQYWLAIFFFIVCLWSHFLCNSFSFAFLWAAGKFWTSHEVFYVIDLAGWQNNYPVPASLFPIERKRLYLHFEDEESHLFSVYAREEVALFIEYQQVKSHSAQPAVYVHVLHEYFWLLHLSLS